MENKIREIEKKIKYTFQKKQLLNQALTHSSFVHERGLSKNSSNERLEFLGDAVLELISSKYLYRKYPEKTEGELTKLRASMVCEPALAHYAKSLHLGEYLNMGKGESLSGGRKRDSILADGVEALIGALYLDGGFEQAEEFVLKQVFASCQNLSFFSDSKSRLQEIVQGTTKEEISYILEGETGPDHQKLFFISVKIGNQIYGNGRGRTKKNAEQEAANQAIQRIQNKLK